jgi:hypothetical protein
LFLRVGTSVRSKCPIGCLLGAIIDAKIRTRSGDPMVDGKQSLASGEVIFFTSSVNAFIETKIFFSSPPAVVNSTR